MLWKMTTNCVGEVSGQRSSMDIWQQALQLLLLLCLMRTFGIRQQLEKSFSPLSEKCTPKVKIKRRHL